MSHFTTVETKVNSLSALEAACRKLGYAFEQGDVEVKNYYGERRRAQAKFAIAGPYYVAVVREPGEEESYSLVADWSMIAGYARGTGYRSDVEIQDELLREYALARVMESCAAEGYDIDASQFQVNADGSMELVAVSWGA
jgi:hypothetical protein